MCKEHFEFLVKYEKSIRKMCRVSCRGRVDLCDDLWDVAVDKVARIIMNYDPCHPSGASLFTKVMSDLRWYMWKWMNSNYKRFENTVAMGDEPNFEFDNSDFENLDNEDAVQHILKKLTRYDAYMLELYHLHESTFEDMGVTLGISKSLARRHYLRALRRAQDPEYEASEATDWVTSSGS